MKKELKYALNTIAPDLFETVQAIRSRRFIESQCISDGRAQLAQILSERFQSKVQSGIFAEMMLDPALFPQHMSPKLLGTYEDEVYDFFRKIQLIDIRTVIDIGCAEGYYVVGCARLWPLSQVFAFDLDPVARKVTKRHSEMNGVGDRVHVRTRATSTNLHEVISKNSRHKSLIICDCEGAEIHLIDPIAAPSVRDAHLMVEMHPNVNSAIEEILTARLEESHDIKVIQPQSKAAEHYSQEKWFATLPTEEIDTALNEYRGYTPWLLGSPKL